MHIRTGKPEFDNMIPLIRGFLEKDILDLEIDGEKIRGYRSPDSKAVWLRDYSDMIRGFRYFEKELKSVVTHFADTQAANGRIFDYFTTYPEKLPCERENWTKYVRVPVEADVEYRFIKAAWIAWQATGDDEFILKLMPHFEKALGYILSGWYFDQEKFLVKRPYTIDTWDFSYSAGRHPWLNFSIDENSFWGYMHGDSSGYYEAFRIMAYWYHYFGDKIRSAIWNERADRICDSMNRYCWNGTFYTHFVKITPVVIPGVDESLQLSLSNPMNINRGVATREMAQSIISEYRRRKEATGTFAEWFSIDPPFPAAIFGDDKLVEGAYCNGGIMPLVGGELALAALENGMEKYGCDILKQYYNMISVRNETYLWYFPNGTPSSIETSTSPDAEPTDGWGSSAMLWALVEGVAGIKDLGKEFRHIALSPRWEAAAIKEAEAEVEYPSSGASVNYRYGCNDDSITLSVNGAPRIIDLSLLLPEGATPGYLNVMGATVENLQEQKSGERYFRCKLQSEGAPLEISLKLKRV